MDIHKVIRSLFAKAESTHSEHEAHAAILKAQELMAKYGISALSAEEGHQYASQGCAHSGNRAFRRQLANVIAPNFRVKFYLSNMQVTFFGREDDVKIAKEVFEYTYKFICRETRRLCRERRNGNMSTEGITNTYALGFCRGLSEKLGEQSTALMVIVPPDVNEKYGELSKNFRQFKRALRYDRYAKGIYEQGLQDGRSVLNRHRLPEENAV